MKSVMQYFIFLLSLMIFLIPIISAAFYDGYFSPSDILENEWLVFAGIFLVVFALVYISLVNFFTKKKKSNYPWQDNAVLQNKPAVGVISLVIAFFSASAFVRQGWVTNIFGEAMAVWIFLLVLVVMIILAIPFYKVLKKNIGAGASIFVMILGIWVFLKFVFNPYEFDFYSFNIPAGFYGFYDVVSSFGFLIFLIIVGAVIALMKKSGRK